MLIRPGGIRQESKAATPMMEDLLKRLKQEDDLQGSLSPETWVNLPHPPPQPPTSGSLDLCPIENAAYTDLLLKILLLTDKELGSDRNLPNIQVPVEISYSSPKTGASVCRYSITSYLHYDDFYYWDRHNTNFWCRMRVMLWAVGKAQPLDSFCSSQLRP